jgi:hypothetical protein
MVLLRAAAEIGFSPTSRPRIGQVPTTPPTKAPGETASGAPRRSLDEFLANNPTQH